MTREDQNPIVPQNIGIDLDATLNCLHEDWAKWVVKNHDPAFKIEQCLSWAFHKHTKIGEAIYDYLDDPSIFLNLKVQPNAIKVTQRLSKYHNLYIISHCRNFVGCA